VATLKETHHEVINRFLVACMNYQPHTIQGRQYKIEDANITLLGANDEGKASFDDEW
jgi:hypothetical protein